LAIPVLLLAVAAVAFAAWVYRRWEPPVKGGSALAAVRAAALVLLLLLIWNPDVPLPGSAGPAGGPVVLLDVTRSMGAVDVEGGIAWDRALQRAGVLEREGAQVLHFGAPPPGSLPEEELAGGGPVGSQDLLAPALERVAELGVRSVTLLSDLRVRDPLPAARSAARLGLTLRVEEVARPVRNAGIAEVELPASVAREDSVPVTLVLFGDAAGGGDSVRVEIREEERLVAEVGAILPPPGREARVALDLPPPSASGQLRYTFRTHLQDDGFPDDDLRVRYLRVDAREGGVVLLSLRPDWEPRFLLPLLGDVTGLPTRGYLRLGEGGYLAMGSGEEGAAPAPLEEVQQAVRTADLLVVHGADGSAPGWLLEAAGEAVRLLVLPRDRVGASLGGVSVTGPVPGEWSPVSELPSSPLMGELAGVALEGLPPLSGILPLVDPGALPVPIRLQRAGRGVEEAALVLVEEGRRRRVVTLASGFWRWGFREGTSRDAYRRLWAGVGGWLLGNEPLVAGAGIRPTSWVLPREGAIVWQAPALAGEALALEVRRDVEGDGPGEVVLDTVVTVPGSGTFATPPLPPGAYRYRGEQRGDPEGEGIQDPGEGGMEVGSGRFDVEAYVPELIPVPATLEEAVAEAAAEGLRPGSPRHPLRSHPLPFLLILGLLCGEWIGRRRQGLR